MMRPTFEETLQVTLNVFQSLNLKDRKLCNELWNLVPFISVLLNFSSVLKWNPFNVSFLPFIKNINLRFCKTKSLTYIFPVFQLFKSG